MSQQELRTLNGMEDISSIPDTPPQPGSTTLEVQFTALQNRFNELMADHLRLAEEHRAHPRNTSGSSGQERTELGNVIDNRVQVWKLPKPDYYLGARNAIVLGTWLTRMSTYMEMQRIPPALQVSFAAQYLKGAAYMWYIAVSPTWQSTDGYISWNFFDNALRSNFLPSNMTQIYWNKWNECRQVGSADRYVARFRQLKLLVEVNDATAFDKFMRGLKPKIQEQLTLQKVTNLESAMELATAYDDISRQFNGTTGKTQKGHSKQYKSGFGNWSSHKKDDDDLYEDNRGTPMVLDMIAGKGPTESSGKSFTGKCFHCGISGHKKSECHKFKVESGKSIPTKNRPRQ
jgi:Ty3 transposon capsid-like protein